MAQMQAICRRVTRRENEAVDGNLGKSLEGVK
jgi:hypothetical protein